MTEICIDIMDMISNIIVFDGKTQTLDLRSIWQNMQSWDIKKRNGLMDNLGVYGPYNSISVILG